MAEVAARLAQIRASTSGLLAGLDEERWSDADVRAPSVLPGWTRGHVLTHLARNADGITATYAGALRDEIVPRYPKGPTGRAEDIEAGAERSAVELLADVRDSADRLDRLFGALTDAGAWERPTDGERPASAWLNTRWREVEIHRTDLGGRYGAADWPAAFVDYLLPRLAEEVGERATTPLRIEIDPNGSTTTGLDGSVWTSGSDAADRIPVRGPDWAVLAWLIGRPALAGDHLSAQPELAAWS
ncbi:MAG TPA: maleylpyruvate isomerase family mycothiol-dependent enzyme [Jatrophihabitantaceae bacterium]|jgi:maleylpyruvate isomerase